MTTAVFHYRTPEYRQTLANLHRKGSGAGDLGKLVKKMIGLLAKHIDKVPNEVGVRMTQRIQDAVQRKDSLDITSLIGSYQEFLVAFDAVPEAKGTLQKLDSIIEKLDQDSMIPVEREVANGRLLADPSFNTYGFKLVPHVSQVTDWKDTEEVRRLYYPDIASLVQRLSGASMAVCNSHLYRRSGYTGPLAKLLEAGSGTIMNVHNDFTEPYFDAVLRLFKQAETKGMVYDYADFGAIQGLQSLGVTYDQLCNSRLVVFNTWRNVGDAPLTRCPLAVVDKRTVSPNELIPGSIGSYGSKVQGLEVCVSEYNPEHKFYYMPKMTKDEVLIIKTYDSAEIPFRPTLHTSFHDPDTTTDAAERTSVDARVLCLFPRIRPTPDARL